MKIRWKDLPPGRIARTMIVVGFLAVILIQQTIATSRPAWLGLAFLGLAAVAGSWKRPATFGGWFAFLGAALVFAIAILSEAPLPSQLAVGALVVVLSVLGLLQRSEPVLQHLFLCRFPIFIALLFVVVPSLATTAAVAPMLGNLFVLELRELAIVSALAVLASWVLLLTMRLIISHAHLAEVATLHTTLPDWAAWKGSEPKPRERVLWFYSLLALPLIWVALTESAETGVPTWQRALAVLVGVAVARGVFAVAHLLGLQLTVRREGRRSAPSAKGHRPDVRVADWLRSGSTPDRALPSARIVIGFFVATFLIYAGGYFVLHPTGSFSWFGLIYLLITTTLVGLLVQHWLFWMTAGTLSGLYLAGLSFDPTRDMVLEVPALAYVLVLTILIGWLLAILSFYFDRHRVPVLPVLVLVPLALYFLVDIDHYYNLVRLPPSARDGAFLENPGEAADGDLRFVSIGPQPDGEGGDDRVSGLSKEEKRLIIQASEERLLRWRTDYPDDPPLMVLVSASGGGITSSLWTAHVLSTLQERCPKAVDATHLISAVSGGGVGAMYFLDAYEQEPGFGVDVGHQVVEKAGRSSLSASAWGMAYPDFWRSFSLRHPWDRLMDRAWAMEKAWERTLRPGAEDRIPTLAAWGERASEGEMPAMIFNATVSETGDRFVMPSLELRSIRCAEGEEGCRERSKMLARLYDRHSMSVVTAARLSATFPFVSPIARAALETEDGTGYHIADGGYYDNFGVVSLVEWLFEIIEDGTLADGGPVNVVILEIRAYPTERDEPKARERAGWLYASAGPLTTMLQVRTSSQIARNDLDFDLVREFGGDRFLVKRVPFNLERRDAPISWHLSKRQRDDITSDPLTDELAELQAAFPGVCGP